MANMSKSALGETKVRQIKQSQKQVDNMVET